MGPCGGEAAGGNAAPDVHEELALARMLPPITLPYETHTKDYNNKFRQLVFNLKKNGELRENEFGFRKRSGEAALRNAIFVGCLSETVSIALLTEERELTREPVIRRVVDQLAADGALSGGMRPKVAAIRRALDGGVPRVHVVDGRAGGALLEEVFTTDGSGTLVVTEADDMPAEPL